MEMIEPGATVPSGVAPAALTMPAGEMAGADCRFATTLCGPFIVRKPGLSVPERSPPQPANLYPELGTGVTLIGVPLGKNPSGEAGDSLNVALLAGLDDATRR